MIPLPEPPASVLDEVIDLRRHLHRHPEVSFEEHETSRMIAGRLQEYGLTIHPCPTETGAVATLDGGRPGQTILLRSDIDALPILEESGVDFPSALEGRMHACGHDGHTAIMLGVAHTLAQIAEELPGRYLFVFQPAEEIVSGARLMIANGLLEQHHADFAIGLHLAAWAESGAVITKPGLLWGGSDAFEITFKGPGGHGGMMGRAGNVINAQAFLVERLMTIVEGLEWEDGTPCHTTIGDVRTDGAWNIVPRHALVKGSLRTFNAALRTQALQRLEDLLLETRTEFSVESDLKLVHGTIPLLNHPTPTEIVLETARELIGEKASILGRPLTVSDDVAEFLTQIPGCYFELGAKPPELEQPTAHHSPFFLIDEAAFATGVRVLAGSAVRLAERDFLPSVERSASQP